MLSVLICLLLNTYFIQAHNYGLGTCPKFEPIMDFDWDKFANVTWYVMAKTSTSSRCLTEFYYADENGFKSVRQTSQSKVSKMIGLNEETVSIGKLSQPQVYTAPASMIVKFPLNMVGFSSFVIIYTDYSNSAVTCTCQDLNLGITYVNRKSCSVLQRKPMIDSETLKKMRQEISDRTNLNDHDLSHIEEIDHNGCKYDGRPLTIELNKIEEKLNL